MTNGTLDDGGALPRGAAALDTAVGRIEIWRSMAGMAVSMGRPKNVRVSEDGKPFKESLSSSSERRWEVKKKGGSSRKREKTLLFSTFSKPIRERKRVFLEQQA